MVWGFFIVVPGVLCQVASIAEVSSVQPIAGAQYHWTWEYAPPRRECCPPTRDWRRIRDSINGMLTRSAERKFITWLQGWVTWTSWIALLAGIANIAANVITVIVTANYPNYVSQGWHVILIMWAILIVLGLLNMYAFWLIPWIELLAGLLHIILWVVFAVVLLVLAPRHTSSFVFLEKANSSGWTNDFVSFNLGIVLITWGFVGFDAVAHISEVCAYCTSHPQHACTDLNPFPPRRKREKLARPSPAPCSGRSV